MTARAESVRQGRWLAGLTLGYNLVEGIVAIAAGTAAASVALVGFGVDSGIELSAGAVALWRLAHDADPVARERAERRANRLIGLSFLALAAWVAFESVGALARREAPSASPVGIALAALSLAVMPWLAWRKRRVARALGSAALAAEATQTMVCTWLSAILLGGLGLNALAGWWWADPAAALAMVPLIAREGVEGLRGRATCTCHAPVG